jgi:hypothetical protein
MDVPWADRLLSDLERQAETERLLDRDAEVEQLTQDVYRAVEWVDRLRAARGTAVAVSVLGYGPFSGTVDRVGRDWCVLRSAEVDLVVSLEAVLTLRGLRDAVIDPGADPVWSRLGIGAVLREAIQERWIMRVFLRDGSRAQGVVLRAGADFCELDDGLTTGPVVLPWRQLAAFTAR